MNYEIVCIHRRVGVEPHDEVAVIGVRDKHGHHIHYRQEDVIQMMETNRHNFYLIRGNAVLWLHVIERRRTKYVMLFCRRKRIATNCLLNVMPCAAGR